MTPKKVTQDAHTFIGIQARTSNANEMQPELAKIPQLWANFFKEGISASISNKVEEQSCYGIYSDYENDVNGLYTLTVGAKVADNATPTEGLHKVQVPATTYLVFTTPQGAMPDIVIQGWKDVWQYFETHPEIKRSYTGDFELYDERVKHPQEAIIDIYIAIQ